MKHTPITHVGGVIYNTDIKGPYFHATTVFASEELAIGWLTHSQHDEYVTVSSARAPRRVVLPVLSIELGSPLIARTNLVEAGAE